jgi:hypothetical protein
MVDDVPALSEQRARACHRQAHPAEVVSRDVRYAQHSESHPGRDINVAAATRPKVHSIATGQRSTIHNYHCVITG